MEDRCQKCGRKFFEWWMPFFWSFCHCYELPKRVSQLEELDDVSGDDYLLITDTSEQKSKKVKLSVIKRFIKS